MTTEKLETAVQLSRKLTTINKDIKILKSPRSNMWSQPTVYFHVDTNNKEENMTMEEDEWNVFVMMRLSKLQNQLSELQKQFDEL